MAGFFDDVQGLEANFEGTYNGEQKTIPDKTELECLVYECFNGMVEGKGLNECVISLIVTQEGSPFKGQKYRFKPKIWDNDAAKRDLGKRNLFVIDAQSGMHMSERKLELTTDNMDTYWSGKAYVRAEFGLLLDEQDGREVNFIRGLGNIREKMMPNTYQQKRMQQAQSAQQPDIDDDIPF